MVFTPKNANFVFIVAQPNRQSSNWLGRMPGTTDGHQSINHQVNRSSYISDRQWRSQDLCCHCHQWLHGKNTLCNRKAKFGLTNSFSSFMSGSTVFTFPWANEEELLLERLPSPINKLLDVDREANVVFDPIPAELLLLPYQVVSHVAQQQHAPLMETPLGHLSAESFIASFCITAQQCSYLMDVRSSNPGCELLE